jgi:hypothetical protein
MANTIDSALLIDTLATKAETVLANRLAPLRCFSKDFSTDNYSQGKSIQVPIATAGSTTLTNPTNFESGDSTLGKIAVTMNHYSQPFHVTSAQYNSKTRIEQLAGVNLNALADKIGGVCTALILAANYTGTAEVVAVASFAAANAKSVWGKLAKTTEKYLILDPAAYANLLPTDRNSFDPGLSGAFGFAGIFAQNNWTGATANTYGFACSPEAMAIASGIPDQVPGLAGMLTDQRTVTLDQLGLSVQINTWVSPSTRSLWASYDVMFGAAAAQAGAGILIKSA